MEILCRSATLIDSLSVGLLPVVQALDQAFEEIFRDHYHMAYRTAYGVIGKSQDAEDVAQTILLRLLHSEWPIDLVSLPLSCSKLVYSTSIRE